MSHSWSYGEQFSFSPPVKYKGLINQGATCYLNSVLQVLFMTDDFREAVERYPEKEFIDHELKGLFGKLRYQTADTFDITKKLDIKRVYEQRDAAEYFEKILNLTSSESSQIFVGKQAHRAVCSACKTQRDTDGKFWHLPLTLTDSDGEYNVANGIKEYFRPSTFSGENQMYCEQCEAKCDATIDCVIKHHPEVLLLQLKRFELDYDSMTYFKINHTVLIPHTLQIPENQTYELYAVVEHVGDLRCGHYSACIKSQEEDRWFKFDDARVTEVDFQSDNPRRSNTAYLLFYRKKSDTLTPEEFTPGGCSSSTSDAEVNRGEYQEYQKSSRVGIGVKQGGEKRVKGDFKTASEVNSGADKVKSGSKKSLTMWDLVFNTLEDDVKVGDSMQNMARDDQAMKQGSSSRYESREQHRVVNTDVQRAKEQKRRDETQLEKGRTLMTNPEGDIEKRSSDDQDSVTHPVQKVEGKGDSSSTQTGLAKAQGEVRKTQARADSEGTVEENQTPDKSGTCIVRIYEEEKRVTPSVTVRSTEKIDIKLKTLQSTSFNRGGSLEENMRKGDNTVPVSGEAFQFPPFQEEQNKKMNLDVRSLLAKLSQDNMFEIRCQSPAPQNHVAIHEKQVLKGL